MTEAAWPIPDDPGPRGIEPRDPERRSRIATMIVLALMIATFGAAMFLLGRISVAGAFHPAAIEAPAKARIA